MCTFFPENLLRLLLMNKAACTLIGFVIISCWSLIAVAVFASGILHYKITEGLRFIYCHLKSDKSDLYEGTTSLAI